jgi:hypothetical protein
MDAVNETRQTTDKAHNKEETHQAAAFLLFVSGHKSRGAASIARPLTEREF